ncbi:MAG: M15 family metallopeptidase [Ignavibacteria bacterium]
MQNLFREKSGKYFSSLIIFLILSINVYSQEIKKNNYGLYVVDNLKTYKALIEEDSSRLLIDLEKFIPGIKLDVRYATKNNFFGQAVYEVQKAFLRLSAAKALKKVQQELNKKALGLKIFDAYRPYSVTVKFYEKYPDTNFVASAWKWTLHNRGCAVDLSVIDLKSGEEIEMPTEYDDFTKRAGIHYNNLPEEQIKNRSLLLEVMVQNGFIPQKSEWWHYNFTGWEKYELMDIPFEVLE